MKDGLPVTAVVCGRLRNPSEFAEIVEQLTRARRDGLIGKIVLSTWAEEQDNASDELANVRALGWEVVLPHIVNVPGGWPLFPGNISFQKVQLRAALSTISLDQWVLKLRTDKCASLPNFLASIASPPPTIVQPLYFSERIFSSKILISWANIFAPFFISDTVFLGKCRDLFKLTELLTRSAYSGCDHWAEQLWFSSPFIAASYDMSRAMSDIAWVPIASGLRSGELNLDELITERPQIVRYLALWWLILDQWFSLPGLRTSMEHEVQIEDLLGLGVAPYTSVKNAPGVIFGDITAAFATSESLTSLIDIRNNRSKTGQQFQSELILCQKAASFDRLPWAGEA